MIDITIRVETIEQLLNLGSALKDAGIILAPSEGGLLTTEYDSRPGEDIQKAFGLSPSAGESGPPPSAGESSPPPSAGESGPPPSAGESNPDLAPPHTLGGDYLVPWDVRINTASKGRMKDGRWKLGLGMKNEMHTVERVEGEIAIKKSAEKAPALGGTPSTDSTVGYAEVVDLIAQVVRDHGVTDQQILEQLRHFGGSKVIEMADNIQLRMSMYNSINEFINGQG